jgi:hypothetical protein
MATGASAWVAAQGRVDWPPFMRRLPGRSCDQQVTTRRSARSRPGSRPPRSRPGARSTWPTASTTPPRGAASRSVPRPAPTSSTGSWPSTLSAPAGASHRPAKPCHPRHPRYGRRHPVPLRQTPCSEQRPLPARQPEAIGSQLADRAEELLPRGSAERQRPAVPVGRVADQHHGVAGYFDAIAAVT